LSQNNGQLNPHITAYLDLLWRLLRYSLHSCSRSKRLCFHSTTNKH